jgi:hypothetical protein
MMANREVMTILAGPAKTNFIFPKRFGGIISGPIPILPRFKEIGFFFDTLEGLQELFLSRVVKVSLLIIFIIEYYS